MQLAPTIFEVTMPSFLLAPVGGRQIENLLTVRADEMLVVLHTQLLVHLPARVADERRASDARLGQRLGRFEHCDVFQRVAIDESRSSHDVHPASTRNPVRDLVCWIEAGRVDYQRPVFPVTDVVPVDAVIQLVGGWMSSSV